MSQVRVQFKACRFPWFEVEDKSFNELLEQRVDINAPDHRGETALFAIQKVDEEIINLLISNQADINRQNYSQHTVLWNSINHNPSLISCLLDHNADPTKGSESSNYDFDICTPPLYSAIQDLKLLTPFVEREHKLDLKNQHGWTPIHQAALAQNLEVLQFIDSLGYDLDLRTHSGWSPFHVALLAPLEENSEKLLELFISYRSKLPIPEELSSISQLFNRSPIELRKVSRFLEALASVDRNSLPKNLKSWLLELILDIVWSLSDPNISELMQLARFACETTSIFDVRLGFFILNRLIKIIEVQDQTNSLSTLITLIVESEFWNHLLHLLCFPEECEPCLRLYESMNNFFFHILSQISESPIPKFFVANHSQQNWALRSLTFG